MKNIWFIFFGLTLPLVCAAQTPVSLQQCYQQALAFHESLPMAEQDIRKARAQYLQILGSVTPKITASASEFLQEKTSSTSGTSSNFTRFSTPEISIGVTQPLFHGLIELHALKYNQALKGQREILKKEAQRLLFVDVVTAYYNAAAIERRVDTLQTALHVMDQQKREYRVWYDLGKIRKSESVRLDAQAALLRADLEKLEGDRTLAYEILSFLTGWAPHPTIRLHGPLDGEIQGLSHYLQQGQSRPDLLASRQEVRMQTYTKKMAQGELYPQANLAANLYPHRAGFQQDINWDTLLTVDLPLLNLSTHGKIREGRAALKQSELALSLKRRTVENDIQTAYTAVQSLLAQLQRYNEAVNLAEQSYSLQRQDATHGLTTQFEVLQSQNTWLNALFSRDDSEINLWQETANLMAACGGVP